MPKRRTYTRRYSKRLLTRNARQNVPPSASSLKSNTTSTLRTTTSNLSTSSKRSLPSRQKITKRTKLDITSTSANSNSNVPMDGYTILQNQVLFTLMCKTNCEGCGNRWNGTININKREGLFVILSFHCSSCTNNITIETSPKVVVSDRRDINVRSQIGSHLCGIRYAGLVKLMGAMNLPSPIQDQIYSKWEKNLLLSIKSFSDRSMKKAVEEAVTAANGRELMVSGDGFWQTRGFQSRHGAAALISCNTTPKVLDIETCNKTCNVCMGALAIKKSNPAKYNDVIRSHHCEKNYNKSSGTIEADAVLNMFQRSVSKYEIYYTKYVGDGDSKTFARLSDKPPYPGKVIKKIEDLNHFSKRMKRQLETKKCEYGRKNKLSDGKTIGGKNRLSKTSPKVVASNRRDINVRSQIGGHLCGIRYAGLVKLMGAMNLPSPIQDERYSKWDKNLLISIKSFSNRSMRKAVEEAATAANGRELMVSGDGFWQTRGFQSRHGAAALLSCNTTPKVLDIETCSKTCNVCMGALAIKNSNPAQYNDIIRSHKCEKNYKKSSGTIESGAVLKMFQRSVSNYNIYYTKYGGDRDSKTFAALSDTPPYPRII
ncbi:unnamed protein product [Rotaria sordida]|uniref:Mutator-like transposase domain-containing protein n=1 Tax=Rotaria sordida TaxID=392033 RepID=A0A815HDY1_9BILA|nr:unnamed protein product [Rotaria sordida]